MLLTRRALIGRATALAAALGAGAAPLLPAPAAALEPEAARQHVRKAIDAVLELARAPGPPENKADDLERIFRDYAAMPQIARFAAGVTWREMSGDQQERFQKAFAHFLSTVYARRFDEYSGETVDILKVSDSGRRGLTVSSRVSQTQGEPVAVDWLVTDRPGRIVIADIVIEGVSLLVTQREEISAMLSARGGDIERLISDLAAA